MNQLDKKNQGFNTVLIGLGLIASQYNKDDVILKNLKYSTHAQVLSSNKNYNWISAVDYSHDACKYTKNTWGVETANSLKELQHRERYEVAVLATPPESRLDIFNYLPSLRAVVVEKPLGVSYEHSSKFIEECEKRGIQVQVNLTRRSDSVMKNFSNGDLVKKIGNIQFVFGTYGRGLRNYGTHLIDLIRMIIGEIEDVKSLSKSSIKERGPIKGDDNLSFLINTKEKIQVIMQPLDFNHYREGSLDIWGEKGKIEIVHEGLNFTYNQISQCRSLTTALEISFDERKIYPTGYGDALYDLYENLSDALSLRAKLDSPGISALKTEKIIENIFLSDAKDGVTIKCI